MKFCVSYKNTSKILDKVDEISLIFNNFMKIKELSAFLDKHLSQKININVQIDNSQYEEFIKIIAEYIEKNNANISLEFNLSTIKAKHIDIKELCGRYNVKYFFWNPATTWEDIYIYADYGASEVHIAESLCFEMDNVHNLCKKMGLAIRVYPDVAQSRRSKTNSIQKFFIRPEDIDLYAQYVDVFEIYSDKDVVYEIYAEDKKWKGNLKDLIMSFDDNVDNRGIVGLFAGARLNCERRCLKGEDCNICTRIVDFSDTLKDNHIIIK